MLDSSNTGRVVRGRITWIVWLIVSALVSAVVGRRGAEGGRVLAAGFGSGRSSSRSPARSRGREARDARAMVSARGFGACSRRGD